MNNERDEQRTVPAARCAWCDTERDVAVLEGASHTICPRHYEAMMGALRDVDAEAQFKRECAQDIDTFLASHRSQLDGEQAEAAAEEQRRDCYTAWEAAGVIGGTVVAVGLLWTLAYLVMWRVP